MARCGCSESTCSCKVSAGPGVTVSGDGSALNPYVVSASTTVDCADVRPCISAGQGASYNQSTGVVSARPSTDVGNLVTFGGDGGLYTVTDCTTVRSCLSEGDGVNYDPVTGKIAARLSGDVGNQVAFGGDGGLYVPASGVTCAQVRPCISATDGASYDSSTGVITAALSADPGNTVVLGTDSGLYVPAGAVTCAQVRPCISAGQGATYNSATGVVSAKLSTDAGNTTVFGTDGGLYTPAVTCAQVRACLSGTNGVAYTPATGVIQAHISTDAGNVLALGTDTGLYATVKTGCGLDGAGTASDPLNVSVAAWPFPCSVDTFGGDLYCDSTGRLRTFPRPTVTAQQTSNDQTYPATAVPTATDVSVEVRNFSVTNPDTCRPAFVIFEGELDVDFTLPANSTGMYGIGGDDMVRMQNRGTGTESQVHVQVTKVYNRVIPAGGTLIEPFDIHMGQGTGGATYSRIQTIHRAFLFNL